MTDKKAFTITHRCRERSYQARVGTPVSAATFAVLAALVVIDAARYLLVGKVTVCYSCRAEYSNTAYNPKHQGFDLATSEKYG